MILFKNYTSIFQIGFCERGAIPDPVEVPVELDAASRTSQSRERYIDLENIRRVVLRGRIQVDAG